MELEEISKREHLIKEIVIQWNNGLAEISDDYLKKNEISMDSKMYFTLNKLYLKKKKEDKSINNLN